MSERHAVDRDVVEERVDRAAQRRHRFHRTGEFLVLQRRRGVTRDLEQPLGDGLLVGLAQQFGVDRRAVVARPVALLLNAHDIGRAAIGGQQRRVGQ